MRDLRETVNFSHMAHKEFQRDSHFGSPIDAISNKPLFRKRPWCGHAAGIAEGQPKDLARSGPSPPKARDRIYAAIWAIWAIFTIWGILG